MQALHDAMLEHGLESPWAERLEEWKPEPDWDARITTRVPCARVLRRARPGAARARHPDRPRRAWFAIPRELQEKIWPTEDYELVVSPVSAPTPEDDLFAGITDPA